MANLTIRVQKDGELRAQGGITTSPGDIGDSMVRNWLTLDDRRSNPAFYGPEFFPYTPEQELKAEAAFNETFYQDKFPLPSGRDIGDFVFIGNKSLNEMYAQHQEAYEKIFPSKKSFMELAVYAEALKRENAISFVNPQAVLDGSSLGHEAIMTVQPEVTDVTRRGFFGAIWNRVKNMFGLAGSETAINIDYKSVHKRSEAAQREIDIANKFSISNIVKSDELQQERDQVQEKFITNMRSLSPALMNKDFFDGLTDKEFLNDKTELGFNLRRNSTRVNIARLYLLSQGFSMDDLFATDAKTVEARAAAGKEFMQKVNSGDPKIHAEMCADIFKKLLSDDIYPNIDLTDDRSLVEGYKELRVVEFGFVFLSETNGMPQMKAALNTLLTPEENQKLQARSDSLLTLMQGPLFERYKAIRSNDYSTANEALKDTFYMQEFRAANPAAPDLDRLKATDQLLNEYQQQLNNGQPLSQLITNKNAAIRHHGDVFAQEEQNLASMPAAEQEKARREMLSVKREVSRRNVSHEFAGNNQPQRLSENQKARNNPEKQRTINPM